jgi:hypothetical protein
MIVLHSSFIVQHFPLTDKTFSPLRVIPTRVLNRNSQIEVGSRGCGLVAQFGNSLNLSETVIGCQSYIAEMFAGADI